jgi:ferrochelatase
VERELSPGEASADDRGQRSIGVLLVNLGTPDSPRVRDVRRYLREFLSDRKVVQLSPWIWRPILEGIVLPLRAPRSAELYRSVWTDEGSPLLVHSRRQCELLAARLGERFFVRLGMRYGTPSIASALDEIHARGCERVLLFPLFPQYSASTTGTACSAVDRALERRRFQPSLQTVPPFPSDPGYIDALAARIGEVQDGAQHFVVSFHGLPQAYVDRGDPYLEHCRATSLALQRRLGIADERWSLVFQSRFGREVWLRPYADEDVPALARTRSRVLIAMPGFTADCLETLEEIGLRLRSAFVRAGGEELIVVPGLNEHPAWIDAMERIVRRWSGQGSGERSGEGPAEEPPARRAGAW